MCYKLDDKLQTAVFDIVQCGPSDYAWGIIGIYIPQFGRNKSSNKIKDFTISITIIIGSAF